jgi:hypothetical protein
MDTSLLRGVEISTAHLLAPQYPTVSATFVWAFLSGMLILFVVSCRCEAGAWNGGVREWGAEEVTGDWRKLHDGVLKCVFTKYC